MATPIFDHRVPKWIIASLAVAFKALADDLGIPLYVEGIDSPTEEDYQNTNLSLRFDGPAPIEGSNWTTYRVTVQGLVTAVGDNSAYTLPDYAGRVAEVMRGVIPVYQYPEDPAAHIGCLDIDPRTVESVRLVNLGRVSASSNVRQISVVSSLILDIH